MAAWLVLFVLGKTDVPSALRSALTKRTVGLFFCATLWGFMQILPMPLTRLSFWSGQIADFHSQASAVIAEQTDPQTMTISVDTGVTQTMALRSAGYFCLYLLLLLLIDTRDRLRFLCYVIVYSGLFQAAYGGFMTLSGLEYLLGIKKYTYFGRATGTFVNRNHFAGYLEMTLATGLGLLMIDSHFRAKDSTRRWRGKIRTVLKLLLSSKALMRLILIVMVIGLILSRSRMGNAAFFVSLLITGLVSGASSRSFLKPKVLILLLSVIAVDVILLGKWFGVEQVVQRIGETSLNMESRDEVVKYALPMIKDFSWTGTGAGTFWYIFPSYTQESRLGGYNHAHNDYVEILSNLGIIGFSCLTGVVLMSLWQALKALRHRRSSFVRAMGFIGFMGTTSLLIHSGVDFNLQIPANAMLFITMLAIPTIALSIDKKTGIPQ